MPLTNFIIMFVKSGEPISFGPGLLATSLMEIFIQFSVPNIFQILAQIENNWLSTTERAKGKDETLAAGGCWPRARAAPSQLQCIPRLACLRGSDVTESPNTDNLSSRYSGYKAQSEGSGPSCIVGLLQR